MKKLKYLIKKFYESFLISKNIEENKKIFQKKIFQNYVHALTALSLMFTIS